MIGVDILSQTPFAETEGLAYRRVIPGEPIPLDDGSVDSVSAFDFLEHLPRYFARTDGTAANLFIEMMNEIWRILRPGGVLVAVTPCYPAPGTFVDPTHVNPIAEGTLEYFAGPCHARTLGYGFHGEFEALAAGWLPLGHALWHASAKQRDESELHWRLGETPGLTRRMRQVAGTGLRRIGVIEAPQHVVWVLRRADVPSG